MRGFVELLNILADGEYHSGEEIGSQLGISRAAVWKQLQKLESFDLEIESIKGRGYRLVGGLDLLDSGKIRASLSSAANLAIGQFDIFPLIDSTNNAAGDAIREGYGRGYCCLAEQQTAGRGRRGREWQSPFGRNVYMSQVWEFQSGASALEGLSLSVGLAIVRTITKFGVSGLGLKWPNDILYENKKLAGILLEMQGDPAGVCQVIVGVGLNVDMRGSNTDAISQPWADLSQIVGAVDRNKLVAELMSSLHLVYKEFLVGGFAVHRDEWCRHDAFAGRDVKVQLGDTFIEGVVSGLDRSGGLVLMTADGERIFSGGEVSLRSA